MTHTLTKKETLDDKVDRALSGLANDIIDDVIDFACRLAKHRGSNSLHRNDVRLAFEKRLKVRVPTRSTVSATNAATSSAASGVPSANLPVSLTAPPTSTASYKGNLALVRKAQEHFISSSNPQ